MEQEKTEKIAEKATHNSGILRNMWRTFIMGLRCKWEYIAAKVFFALISSVAPIISSWYFGKILNALTNKAELSFSQNVLGLVAIYALIEIVQPFCDNYYMYFDKLFDTRFECYRQNLLATKRADLDIQKVEDPKFSNLFQKANDNSWRLFWFVNSIIDLAKNIVFFVIIFIVMIQIKWWIAVSIIGSMLPLLYVESKYGKNMWEIWEENADKRRRMWEYVDNFKKSSSLSEIKIFKLKETFVSYIDELWNWFADSVKKMETKRVNLTSLAMIISQGTLIAIFFVLTKQTFEGLIAIGTFTFILSSMQNLRSTTRATFKTVSDLQNNNLFVNDIFKFLDTKAVIQNGQIILPGTTPEIVFKDVSFTYPDTETEVLHGVNVVIKPGTKLAIVGVNGAGKTTFTKLLMRIYDVSKGSVALDGVNVTDVDINSYYQKIGMLSQEYAKYKVLVSELISFGDPTIPFDEERMKRAAELSGAAEFIAAWKEGYNTQLGKEFEGGVEPSIGQWQKLALARMFYKNPQIWILDEPTASIDAVAEMEIFERLHNLPKDKTVILISHRFNTVKNADKIIVIEHGTIQEEGSHDELMKKNGRYAELFNLQKGSYE